MKVWLKLKLPEVSKVIDATWYHTKKSASQVIANHTEPLEQLEKRKILNVDANPGYSRRV